MAISYYLLQMPPVLMFIMMVLLVGGLAALASEAIAHGAYSIEINPDSSTISNLVNLHFASASGKILPEIWQEIIQN